MGCAGQIIIIPTLYSVMASAHVLERFWNGKRSLCPVGPFWNVLERNFCGSVLERFGRELSSSHCAWQVFQNGGNGPDTVV